MQTKTNVGLHIKFEGSTNGEDICSTMLNEAIYNFTLSNLDNLVDTHDPEAILLAILNQIRTTKEINMSTSRLSPRQQENTSQLCWERATMEELQGVRYKSEKRYLVDENGIPEEGYAIVFSPRDDLDTLEDMISIEMLPFKMLRRGRKILKATIEYSLGYTPKGERKGPTIADVRRLAEILKINPSFACFTPGLTRQLMRLLEEYDRHKTLLSIDKVPQAVNTN